MPNTCRRLFGFKKGWGCDIMTDKTLEYIQTVNSLRDADRPYCPVTICANICYDVSGSASRLKLITYIDPKSKIGVVDWQCYQCGYQAPLHCHNWERGDE